MLHRTARPVYLLFYVTISDWAFTLETHTVYNLNTPIYVTLTLFCILLAVEQTPADRGHAWHQQMR